jgi:hypothetical protein
MKINKNRQKTQNINSDTELGIVTIVTKTIKKERNSKYLTHFKNKNNKMFECNQSIDNL